MSKIDYWTMTCDICRKELNVGDYVYITTGARVTPEGLNILSEENIYTRACADCGENCSEAISKII